MKIFQPLTVATRTMILVGAVIIIISLVQGGINAYFMTKEIRSTAHKRMNAAVNLTKHNLIDILEATAENIMLIQAHKSIENYFTALLFEDNDEMTNAVATIEEFLLEIQLTQWQHSKIQLTNAQGKPILQVYQGERIENYDQLYELLDPGQLQGLQSFAEGGSVSSRVHYFSMHDAMLGWIILTVTPIIPENKVEGFLWIYQPISVRMGNVLSNLTDEGITCVILDGSGNKVLNSKLLDGKLLAEFIRGDLSGWAIAEETIPSLLWTIKVGIPNAVLFSLLKSLQISWMIGAAMSFILAMAALWGIKLHQDKLEKEIASNTKQLVDKNEQMNKANDELQVVIQSLQEAQEKISFTNETIEKDKNKLQQALDQISSLIQEVSDKQDFSVIFTNPTQLKCWEELKCGQKNCECYGKEPMRCWQVAGTLCEGEVQGTFANKIGNCRNCSFYQQVTDDPIFQIGEQFNHMMHILEKNNAELVDAYANIKNAQSQMLQQEKMASVGQLAAGVAHEINNPIGFITSNLGSMQKYVNKFIEFIEIQANVLASLQAEEQVKESRKKLKLDFIIEDTNDLLKESLDGARRVSEIVQNLKSFSHVNATNTALADINECLEKTLKVIWNELKYKTTIHKDYGELPQTFCNAQELNQVFMNILVNASHAIEKQGDITIRTSEEDGVINVTITDTGGGIAADKIEHVFEPFFTTKEVGKGTGLGLSICYEIVKKHQGNIKVDSEVGKGTTFTILLPVIKDEG